MKSNVTRLKPRQGSYEDALDAYNSGEFASCVDFIAEARTAEAIILRARAFIRLGDANAAVESIDTESLVDFTHESAAEALSVKSYALHVLRKPIDAAAVAVEARARCYSSGDIAIEGELLFACAFGSLIAGDFASAEISAAAILALEDESPSWMKATSYSYALPYWRARACDVRGVIESTRTNYASHSSWLRRGLEEFDRSGSRDESVHASLLANFADAAITVGGQAIVDFTIARSEMIDWKPSLVAFEFRVFSALAEACSVVGDQIGALRYFRRCLDCAPSAALQIRASLERARLLREIGETFSAREEVDHALRLSRSVNWESVNALEQRQLLLLAGQVASFDQKTATQLLNRYDGLTRSSAAAVAIKDNRSRGEEFMARAAVMQATNQSDRAITMLIDALQTLTSAGLFAKAALAAAELAELTNEPRYVEIALKQSAKQPQSILARKMARFDGFEIRTPVVPAATGSRPKLSLVSY